MFRKAQHLHFVGIGGAGMSGLAEVLVNLGYGVSGSDLESSEATRRLKRLGARIRRGHAPGHVNGADVVVVSSAIKEDNPEVLEARERKIPVIPRAEMLAELMRLKYGVAVAGSHGKTSTTGMIAEVLGGLDPTIVIGGRFGTLGSGAKLGNGELMVAEADESDGSFLNMKPTIAVVTSIDLEHLEHYRDLPEIQAAFVRFLSRVPFYGAAVICLDDPNIRAILDQIDRKVITYGACEEAEVRATDIETSGLNTSYELRAHGEDLGRIHLQVPGRHSVANSLAAVAVALELDVPFPVISSALKRFPGIDRRFQLLGTVNDAMVVDDYGHHPTEILATLAAIREGFDSRTIVVFQPHRYTRTRALLDDFGRAFSFADRVIVTEIYPAGETPLPGIDGSVVADALVRHGHPSVTFEPKLDRAAETVRRLIRPGDIVLTLGAGNVWKVGKWLLQGGTSGKRSPRKKGGA